MRDCAYKKMIDLQCQQGKNDIKDRKKENQENCKMESKRQMSESIQNSFRMMNGLMGMGAVFNGQCPCRRHDMSSEATCVATS